MARHALARDVVRYAGEAVAAIVSETREQGVDAAELVVVEIDNQPAIVAPAEAARNETLLFPDAGTNVAFEIPPVEVVP